jgi:hypothetical protein
MLRCPVGLTGRGSQQRPHLEESATLIIRRVRWQGWRSPAPQAELGAPHPPSPAIKWQAPYASRGLYMSSSRQGLLLIHHGEPSAHPVYCFCRGAAKQTRAGSRLSGGQGVRQGVRIKDGAISIAYGSGLR